MRTTVLPVIALALLCLPPAFAAAENPGLASPSMRPVVHAIGGLKASEDLVQVPGKPWLIVSVRATGDDEPGRLEWVHTDRGAMSSLYPSTQTDLRLDRTSYATCPGTPPQRFDPHGMNLRPGTNGAHHLYVVHHGERESVEIFALDARGTSPKLTWEGCVPTPPGVAGNSVAALPDGFVMTRTELPGHAPGEGAAWLAKLEAGNAVGEILSWNAHDGWREVASGGDDLMPNGIEASLDGRWLYYADSVRERFVRISLGRAPVERAIVQMGFHTDNVHRASDGSLLLAGQSGGLRQVLACFVSGKPSACGHARVVKIDPQTLAVQSLVDDAGFSLASGAVQSGEKLWLGRISGTIGEVELER